MKQTYPIRGIDCVSCATIVKNECLKLDGIETCYVDVENKTVQFEFDDQQISPEAIRDHLEDYGYTLVLPSDGTGGAAGDSSGSSADDLHKSIEYRNLLISIPLVILAFIEMFWMIGGSYGRVTPMSEALSGFFHNIMLAGATIMLFLVGSKYLSAVRRYMRKGIVSMDTLVGIGTSVAYIYSFVVSGFKEPLSTYIDTSTVYYEAVIVVIGFISLGKYIEHRTMTQSGQAVKALLNLQAKKAHRIDKHGEESDVEVEALRVDDQVRIRSGEKIPLDCMIVRGSADVDESMITGESLPVTKVVGDTLIGGTVNINGSLIGRITATTTGSYLAKIIEVVTEAQQSRPAIQALVDRIMVRFVPLVLCIAVGAALVRLIWGYGRVGDKYISIAVASFVGVLVIACPCGIGLATPMAVTTGVGHLAKNGILCKDARGLLKLRKASTFIFDKTGTLTEGKPQVVAEHFFTENNKSSEEHRAEKDIYAQILYAIESHANHPLATAIAQQYISYASTAPEVEDFETLVGAGVHARIGETMYQIVSPKYARSVGHTLDEKVMVSLSEHAMTPICLIDESRVLAILGLADTLKPEAIDTIQQLHAQGKKAVIISGDHTDVVKSIAQQLDITERYAEVSPEEKSRLVRRLSGGEGEVGSVKETKNDNFVVMIGDGINDAPALAQADVGVAMSTGTDIAIESSDMTLLHGDISKILTAIRISDLTHSAIVQNLVWAFSYNIIGIPLAAGALYVPFGLLLNPAFEGAAMAMSDLAVIGNSIRLQKKKV